MSRIIPKLGLRNLSDQQLDDYAQHKIDHVTGNGNFPAPDPTLLVVGAALGVFRASVAAAIDGNKAQTAQKNADRKVLEDLLTALAQDCSEVAGTDVAVYLTSGFDYKKPGVPAGVLPAPGNFRLTAGGNPGEVKSRHALVKNNHGYDIVWANENISPDAMTNHVSSSGTKATLKGLESGKKVYGYVRAVGAKGLMGNWSDVSSVTVP